MRRFLCEVLFLAWLIAFYYLVGQWAYYYTLNHQVAEPPPRSMFAGDFEGDF